MSAAILSIGTELTRGELINSNAAWLSEQLTSLGLEVSHHSTLADDLEGIAEELSRICKSADVVVATGGLGPTSDDLTAKAVAKACGVELVRDESSWEAIKKRYRARGLVVTALHAKQADLPQGAEALPNPVGSAPGFAIAHGSAKAFFMPGVPREMKAIFETCVVSSIAKLGQRDSHQVHIRSFGLRESEVGEMLEDIEGLNGDITIGYRAHFPELEVKVLARAPSAADAEQRAKTIAQQVRERMGDAVYGERDDTFAAVVGEHLRDKGLTLSIAESCTGGMIGAMLTAVPGSSEYLLLDAVTYANSAKTNVLGVSPDTLRGYGAVSSETAAAMAEGARRLGGSDIAVSTTGIAGPGGGTDEKPVGTVWFGLATEQGTKTFRHLLYGDRDQVRTRAAYIALELVRRHAMGKDVTQGAFQSSCEEQN